LPEVLVKGGGRVVFFDSLPQFCSNRAAYLFVLFFLLFAAQIICRFSPSQFAVRHPDLGGFLHQYSHNVFFVDRHCHSSDFRRLL